MTANIEQRTKKSAVNTINGIGPGASSGRRKMERKTRPIEDMAEDMRQKTGGKLYKGGSRPAYNEISQELKAEALAAAITQQQSCLQTAYERGKIDLNNAGQVQAIVLNYLEACKLAAQVPTFAGLAAALGVSRQRLYAFMQDHPASESTAILDRYRSSCATILAAGALSRALDNSTAIFLLKNSGQGYSDRHEIEVAALPTGSDPRVRDTYQPFLAARNIDYSGMTDEEIQTKYFEEKYMKTGIIDQYASLEY